MFVNKFWNSHSVHFFYSVMFAKLTLFCLVFVALACAQNTPPPPYSGSYYDDIDTSLRGKAFEVFFCNLYDS